MLLTSPQARELIAYSIDRRFAMLAVNADSPSAVFDCLKAAKRTDSPIIIETSLRQLQGISFGAGDPVRGMALYIAHLNILAGSEEFFTVPVVYHTDHIRGPDTQTILKRAIEGLPFTADKETVRLSPSSISVDASQLSEEENVSLLCRLIETSKKSKRPVTLEMEAGLDRGYTPPEETERLVHGVEQKHPGYIALFAPGLGNRHGYSEGGYPDFRPEHIGKNAALLERLTGRKIGIVLHGSSGLSDDQIREAVKSGLTKMNVSTNATIIRSRAAREYYEKNAERLRPDNEDFIQTAIDNGVGSFVSGRFVPAIEHLLDLLGSAGKAGGFMEGLKNK
ncbi:MAG: class II fructose-bisphosphate aldolase [Spirochaetes bacterium]|nr:class II fructose-bisphosphate aldolase [Spirochaetota bacterium]